MRKYIASALVILLTLLLIASINQISQSLYRTSEGAVAGNGPTIAGIEDILGLGLNQKNQKHEYGNIELTNLQTTSESIDVRENLRNLPAAESSSALMIVKGAAHTSYLRGGVYVKYLNGKWYRLNETPVAGNRGILPRPQVKHVKVSDNMTVVLMYPIVKGNLLTALYTEEVNAPTELRYYNESHLFGTSETIQKYAFKAVHYVFPESVLKEAKTIVSEQYLQTPDVSERVLELARNITQGIEGDYLKAKAIESYLRTHYEYDENAPPAPEGIDPLEWFLFHSKRGVCLDFNTAFVILARLNGIPARLVTGYLITETPVEQAVYPNQAHAWAEVPFEGLGWVTFDATPSPQRQENPETSIPPSQSFDISIEPELIITDINEPFQVYVTVIPRGIDGVNELDFNIEVSVEGLYSISSTIEPNVGTPFDMMEISEPGIYHPTVKVTIPGTESRTIVRTFTVIVRGGAFSLEAEPENLTLTPGDVGKLKIYVKGSGYSKRVNLDVRYPGEHKLQKESGIPYFESELILRAPSKPSHYIITIVGTSKDSKAILQVPLRVLEHTLTRITSYPSELLRGQRFWVKGTVTDRNGNPVDGPVYVTLNKSKDSPGVVVGSGVSVNGRFSVECFVPPGFPLGDYHIVAHFGGSEYYLPSNSDPNVIVKDKPTIQVEKKIVTKVGKFELGGKLVDSAGNGIPNAIIEVSLNETFRVKVTTDSTGVFTTPIVLETPGKYQALVSYGGSEYYLSTTATINITAVETAISAPSKWIIGKNITINGSILGVDSGKVSLLTPMGRFNGTLERGRFSFTIPVNISPGIYNVFFAYEDVPLEEITATLVSPTNLFVKFSKMREGKNATVVVKLVDALGNPLPEKVVVLNFFGNHTGKTDINGTALFTVKPSKSGKQEGTAVFEGDEFYLPSTTEFEVSVAGKPPYTLIFAGLLMLPAGLIVYTKRKSIASALRKLEKMQYSQILHPDRTPPVYGEREKITITSDVPVKLLVNGKLVGEGDKFELALPKGTHEISAKGEKAKGRLKVWVVDYREEIMRLYDKCFLELARREGVERKDVTPEELVYKLRDKYNWNDLKTVTYLFEVVKYSLYPVGRREFMEFYTALSRLIGGDCYEED